MSFMPESELKDCNVPTSFAGTKQSPLTTDGAISRSKKTKKAKTCLSGGMELDVSPYGGDVPFLRAASNSDIFTLTQQGNDYSLPSLDWSKMGDSDHFQSEATIGYAQGGNWEGKMWSSAFDTPFPESGSSSHPIAINPKDLEESNDSKNETMSGASGHLMNTRTNHAKYGALSVKPQIAMEAVQALGATTFSTSFIDRITEQSHSHEMNEPASLAHSFPPMDSYSPYPMQHDWMGNPQPYPFHNMISSRSISEGTLASWQHISNPFMSNTYPMHPSMSVPHNAYAPPSDFSLDRIHDPAPKKRPTETMPTNRRKTTQHTLSCTECSSELGIAFIRGSIPATTEENLTKLCCTACVMVSSMSPYDHQLDRKRKRKDVEFVSCEVCHCKIGSGSGCDVKNKDIRVEFVCRDCGDKYMFCSECGGGGKQRTGKWRPRELFESGRRTCSLPHIRVGSAELHYKVIRIEDLTPQILNGIQDVFFDCMLSLYCVPSVMTSDRGGSFEVIKREIEQLWITSIIDVLQNNVLFGKKYVTVAWIHKRHRNKGVGRSNPSKDSVSWLHRLGLAGVLNTPRYPMSMENEDKHHCYVAFSIAEWSVTDGTIFMAQMAPRSVFLKTMEGYMDLIRNCIEEIQKEARQMGVTLPEHIWCWAKADHARLQSVPTRLKFMTKNDYLANHEELDPSVFERDTYVPLQSVQTHVYASSVKSFASSEKR